MPWEGGERGLRIRQAEWFEQQCGDEVIEVGSDE